jgi:cellulose synthase operon protein YhjQ
MTDLKALLDSNDTPEDVATLYSCANLHGAKYRDFSASRAQTREKARQRVQEAIAAERRRARNEAEVHKQAEANAAAEAAIVHEAQRKREQVAHRAQAIRPATPYPNGAYQPAPGDFSYGQPQVDTTSLTAHSQFPGQPISDQNYTQPAGQPPYAGSANHVQYVATPLPPAAPVLEEQFRGREDHFVQVRNPWAPAETREVAAHPAWLSATEQANAPKPVVPPAPEDTLQKSRDRLTSRWFALNGLFHGGMAAAEAVPSASTQPAPVLAVFSLAGGVGKTSLVATLGRALSARRERILLVDTAAFGLLAFFYGASDQRPGVLRTFTAPTTSGDSPVQMISLDPESLGPEAAPQETLTQEISRYSRTVGRVIVDLATASGATTRRVLRLSPTVLVPVVPDMNSVVSVSSIDSFFQHNLSASGQPVRPYYLLNQFDPSLPLHRDVREVLREQVGERLLPFALCRNPAVSEALAEGMTVVDYAPNSNVAEDYGNLAGWVKRLAPPATHGFRGVRWSEK